MSAKIKSVSSPFSNSQSFLFSRLRFLDFAIPTTSRRVEQEIKLKKQQQEIQFKEVQGFPFLSGSESKAL